MLQWKQNWLKFSLKDKSTAEAIEDELGLAGAAEEDADAEYIRKVCDVEIVTGNVETVTFKFV